MSDVERTESEEDNSRRIEVDLFIVHPTMTPTEISAALGLESPYSHCVGDPRKAPNGVVLGGNYRDTRWRHSIRWELDDQRFGLAISALVEKLVPHKVFLDHVRSTGGRAQIILQDLGDGYLGDTIPFEVLAKMVELKLDFGFELFKVPQNV
jgi:hypothetical protein